MLFFVLSHSTSFAQPWLMPPSFSPFMLLPSQDEGFVPWELYKRGHMQQYEEGGVTKYEINYRLQLEKRTLE
jgi:hypothetical protein